MRAKTERLVMRWAHMILSIPILGIVYGDLAENPRALAALRYVFVPIVILSGLWMWKGPAARRLLGLAGRAQAPGRAETVREGTRHAGG